MDNFMFYTTLLLEFISRACRLDLRSAKDAHLLLRGTKVRCISDSKFLQTPGLQTKLQTHQCGIIAEQSSKVEVDMVLASAMFLHYFHGGCYYQRDPCFQRGCFFHRDPYFQRGHYFWGTWTIAFKGPLLSEGMFLSKGPLLSGCLDCFFHRDPCFHRDHYFHKDHYFQGAWTIASKGALALEGPLLLNSLGF